MAEGAAVSQVRRDVVGRVVKEWINDLVDLGGRNNLLHYRDLRSGTLDLDGADPVAIESLLKGRTVRLTTCFDDEQAKRDAVRRARAIHRKAKENYEERGISTLYLASGAATWNNVETRGWAPNAPVLLIPASLDPVGAALDDFQLSIGGDAEVNPTLLHIFQVDFGCEIDPAGLQDVVDGPVDEPWEIQAANEWLVRAASSRVPEVAAVSRLVLANFSYAKLPMVRDLESAGDMLAAHDLIAAIAGDADARRLVHEEASRTDAMPPLEPPPSDEFLVLDADSSQTYAINAVLGGQHLIMRGPPGTGKSQSIANLVAALTARGKHVLFVAEKRAAIDAVLKRLQQVGLGDLVLDLHGRVTSRRAFAEELARSLEARRTALPVDESQIDRQLEWRRGQLNGYADALHKDRAPWGVSVYEARTRLMGLKSVSFIKSRLSGATLDSLGAATYKLTTRTWADFVGLDGFRLPTSGRPWAIATIRTPAEAERAAATLDQIRGTMMPRFRLHLEQACNECGIPPPPTIEDATWLLGLWDAAREIGKVYRPSIYGRDLQSFIAAMEPAMHGGLNRLAAIVLSAQFRAARRQLIADAITRLPDHALAASLPKILDVQNGYGRLRADVRVPGGLELLQTELPQLRDELARLQSFVGERLGTTRIR